MPVALALWSTTIAPNHRVAFIPPVDLLITNASLDLRKPTDAAGRTCLRLEYSDAVLEGSRKGLQSPRKVQSAILCCLTLGKAEQHQLRLVVPAEESFSLYAHGPNAISLTGNYIDQDALPLPDQDQVQLEASPPSHSPRLQPPNRQLYQAAEAPRLIPKKRERSFDDSDQEAPVLLKKPKRKGRAPAEEPQAQIGEEEWHVREQMGNVKGRRQVKPAAQPIKQKHHEHRDGSPVKGDGKYAVHREVKNS
ncbi:uncharacterized protein PHACADRAFT_201706 [Phanerochaete carnosa HHB-10118-sp]|uniref:Nucleoplasmin-like domain-containing protein n=1 Tax=Phanerochaete carnosa (strain HHB-10118-sp) TaxID=650164 RepID=K5VE85_PHACS|nr:uncharacterized protein PHACADRAFT_201706 [Phanerochaete carnosa HHB-10118-sp]EKM49448.1 hypothetical protein PHACADRAFT_201706 [Phanerochaete carnosa HHB-10118-sp]